MHVSDPLIRNLFKSTKVKKTVHVHTHQYVNVNVNANESNCLNVCVVVKGQA